MFIQIKNLSKVYKKYRAVNKINFEIEQNKTIGLLGPNGCGKTTSIGMILGLITPTEGEIIIDDKNLKSYKRDEILNRLNFASPYVPWTMMVWAYQSSARWALDIYSGVDVVGGFMVVYQLCYSPMAIGFVAISSFLGPIIYQRSSDMFGDLRHFRSTVKMNMLLGVGLFLLVVFLYASSHILHAPYFALIVPNDYQSYSSYMGLVVIAGFFAGLGELFLLKFQKDMRVIAVRNIRLACSIFGVISIFMGAKYFGIDGVIYALLVTSVINFILFYLGSLKI